MPIDVFIQEASDLLVWIADDKAALTAIGVNPASIATLPQRIDALIKAQSAWAAQQLSTDETYEEYQQKRVEAEAMRDELRAAFRYGYRSRPDLTRQIKSNRGRGSAETLIQVLYDLSVLGLSNQEMLQKISFDTNKLQTAAALSTQLSRLLAKVNGKSADKNNTKLARDKAYTLLKEVVEEIRLAGKFVFRANPRKLRGYKSSYWAGK